MPILLQINVTRNVGSTGTITEAIANIARANGWVSYIASGRYKKPSDSHTIQIGSWIDTCIYGVQTRIFDRHGLGSEQATQKFIEQIKVIKPDIIHLHNLHGYYINIRILFNFLSKSNIPIVWTLHDCWPLTGHCAHFDFASCDKWKTECYKCPEKRAYPASLFLDRSTENYYLKKALFTSVKKMVIVPVSNWLKDIVLESFLGRIPVQTIHNGIDTSVFKPQKNSQQTREKYCIGQRFMLLGVASPWTRRKGLNDFIELSGLLNEDEVILLVGLNSNQVRQLPPKIIGLTKTENRQDLIDIYSAADLFINPTWEDNFPTTNLESLACGTPLATYRTGGSVEAVSSETGFIVDQGDIPELIKVIRYVKKIGKNTFSEACRKRAIDNYSKDDRFVEYLTLYESLIRNKSSVAL